MTVGVFDSGIGGLTALFALHRMLPNVDCLYFADRANAPYGNKTKKQLTELVTRDISKLQKAGADRILIACCTASTVYEKLPEEYRKIALPILLPTAKAALSVTKNKKIGVICTDATARSGAFTDLLTKEDASACVTVLPTQSFVSLVESGISDSTMTKGARSVIERTLSPLADTGIDTLILGCTHFSHIRRTVSDFLPNVSTVCSALCGAEAMADCIKESSPETLRQGSLIYLD